MFPLNVIIIGAGNDLAQLLRLELAVQAARVEATYLGVESAIAALRAMGSAPEESRRTPPRRPDSSAEIAKRLFIVRLDSVQELPAIKRLSSFYPGNPILVLMEPSADPTVPIQAMRAGASQVVNLPLQAEDFKQAIDCIGTQFGKAMIKKVIAIAGSTGGCGATTLAINLAYEIAHANLDQKILLSELSVHIGKLQMYLNVEPRCTTQNLLRDIHRIDLYFMQQALTPIVDRFNILAGPYTAVSVESFPPNDVLLFIECLRQLADIVVLDVPCTYDATYFETLKAADQVVIVGEQKVPSIRTMQMIQEQLERKCSFLINRFSPNLPAFSLERLSQSLRSDDIMTVVSDYYSVSSAVNQGLPLRLKDSRSRVLADIAQIASVLVPPTEQAEERKPQTSGVFRDLMKALRLKA